LPSYGFGAGSSGQPRRSDDPEYQAGRCKDCGKEVDAEELEETGLCKECRREIKVGLKPPVKEEEKKDNFGLLRRYKNFAPIFRFINRRTKSRVLLVIESASLARGYATTT
jgi:DNA-directed RNA polymerase subunit RPC12/RpoP